MDLLIVDLLYGLVTTSLGAAAASWLWWSHFRRRAITHDGAVTSPEARHATEVLLRLQELAGGMAFDVDEHSSQAEEINDKTRPWPKARADVRS